MDRAFFSLFLLLNASIVVLGHVPKPAGLVSIALLAVVAWRRAKRTGASLDRRLAIGLCFCFAGDTTLAAGLVPVALGLFLIGYAFYSAGFLAIKRPPVSAAVWLVIGLGAWYATTFRGVAPPFLLWAALVYAIVLAALPATAPALRFRIAGIVLLASDVLIALRMFRQPVFMEVIPVALQADVVWLAYALGQGIMHAPFAGGPRSLRR